MKTFAVSYAIGLLVAACLSAVPAHAQLARTWVASNGDNAAVCSRAFPCASLQTAHNKTNAGGEINCVDSGNFASVLIIKTITIDCAGALAGDSTSPFMFKIDAPGATVKLRNLSMNGINNFGATGIDFVNGAALFVENCTIIGFRLTPGIGIKFTPPAGVAAKLFISDSVVSDNGLAAGGGGIIIQPAGSGSAQAVLNRVQVENNFQGILVDGTGSTGVILVEVRDSVVAGNLGHGIAAISSAGHSPTGIIVDRTSSAFNAASGIFAQGAAVHLGNSTVTGNATGLNVAGGQILSYQNNQTSGNFNDGAPTGVLTLR